VVTVFLELPLGRMLKDVVRVTFRGGKSFHNLRLIYYYNDNVTLLLEIFTDSFFRPFVSKFPLHVLHSTLHF